MEQDVLNLEEAVAFLKTSKPTLYRWLKEGRIKSFKVGREWRFYRSDLMAFVETSDQEQDLLLKQIRQAIEFYDQRISKKIGNLKHKEEKK